MAYTGVSTLEGDNLDAYYGYLKELFGRPVFTHEIPDLYLEIRKKSKSDFQKICSDAVEN